MLEELQWQTASVVCLILAEILSSKGAELFEKIKAVCPSELQSFMKFCLRFQRSYPDKLPGKKSI